MCHRILIGLLLAVGCPAIGWCQEARGAILGRITDASGAIIPGARIRATNLATNTTASSVSNQEGNFEIPYLLPGSYRVTAELKGFKTAVRDSIELRVDDRLTLDFMLQVGELSDSIVVTGETPLLNTATASVGAVVDERRVSELPIGGGNPFSLTVLAPGVMNNTRSMENPWDWRAGSDGIIVNGTRTGSSEVTLDGVTNMAKTEMAYSPPQDLVQEFKLQTASFDASLGHAVGAWVNVSMKSGANMLHGSGYFFDARVRAVPWFSNRWLYDPATGPVTDEKRQRADPGFLKQRMGATATGPVVIPRLYDGHNRTFWSFGFERLTTRDNQTVTQTVPTPEERAGDFSALLKLGSIYQIYDPRTIAPAAQGRFSRQPLPGNLIPSSRIDPMARKILEYWPTPNASGTADGKQNYFRIGDTRRWNRSVVGRVDHNLSETHRMFFRVNHNLNTNRVQALPSEATGRNPDRWGYGAVIDDVYVFNPELLLNVRYGVTNQVPRNSYLTRGFDLLGFGFSPALINEIRTKSEPMGIMFPEIIADAFASLGGSDFNTRTMTYQTLAATVTKMSGNHSMRFGGEFRVIRQSTYNFANVAPSLEFGATWTRGPLDNSPAAPIGQGLASMLLGLPSGGGININASRAEQSTFTAVYFQDDWKVSRRLTLNMGIRYEYETPITERYNRTVRGFDFSSPNPVEQQARANYAQAPIPQVPVQNFRVTGGSLFAGVGGQPRELWHSDTNNVAPRIGLAYRLTAKTAVRAGYGIFYGLMGVDRLAVNQAGFGRRTGLIASNDNGLSFIASIANPFPGGLLEPLGAAGGLLTNVGKGVAYFNERPAHPYMQRWSLSIQREMPARLLLDISYLGNRGTKLATAVQQNPIPASYLSTSPLRDQAAIDLLSAQVTNPFSGISDFAGTGFAGARIGRSQLLRPYPHFTSLTTELPVGYSYYHSLQISMEKRLEKGITFLSSWTWSKFMEATAFQNETDLTPEKVISDMDFPHRFVVSAIYEIPVGRGKPLLGGVRGVVDHLLGGWQLQGVYEGQSGRAMGFGNAIFYGDLDDIPLPVSQRTAERWFNIDAGFERAVSKQLGSNIRRLSTRFNNVRGDGVNNFNLSLFKNFPLAERVKLQFRCEAYNAMNHVQFNNPNTTVTSSAFGSVTGQKENGQRSVTFAAKLLW